MNKDQVEGKVKDVAGRVERQAGEWTGDKEKQAHGALEQVAGKVQNAWGKAKAAGRRAADKRMANKTPKPIDDSVETEVETENEDDVRSRGKVS
jgi:uncharacterized protein YjbJ (UPF0337 family)